MKASVLCSELSVAIAACASTKQVRAEDATMNDMNKRNGMDGRSHMENLDRMNEAMNMKRENQLTRAMNKAMNENDMPDKLNIDMAMKRAVQDMNDEQGHGSGQLVSLVLLETGIELENVILTVIKDISTVSIAGYEMAFGAR
ncbi:hypothetical protein N8T08_000442 [Aspergillus melleus]|uniref:Uncharacterized protein n=1 Tax=Aspergillus melleus TaxID=138277 RepID=A0ACC3BBI9_9EURO|nr:hypothetical protein N8T08_000442 [Aspergillus melleus]